MTRVIKVKQDSGVIPGEIKHAMRDTRLMAVRGAKRLPPGVNVILLYSLLYDPDARVRALAEDSLKNLSIQDVDAFIQIGGHPKVLDFIARNTPKGSGVLDHVAQAPTLAKRTMEFLEQIGVPPKPIELHLKPSRDESSWTGTNPEWSASLEEDLPDGVEFSLPTDEEGPAVRPSAPASDESEANAGIDAAESTDSPTDPEYSAAESVSDYGDDAGEHVVTDHPVGDGTDNEAVDESEAERKAVAEEPPPPPVESSSSEMTPPPEPTPAPRIKPMESRTPKADESLFPVHDSKAPATEARKKKASAKSGDRKPVENRSPQRRIVAREPEVNRVDILKWVIFGLLLGGLALAGYVALDRYKPELFDKVKFWESSSIIHSEKVG